MNQNLEELKELLMYSYRKLGYTVTTDKDMLYLRFSPDSQSPAVMVRCANESRPLDRAAVQQMFMEFERMGGWSTSPALRMAVRFSKIIIWPCLTLLTFVE